MTKDKKCVHPIYGKPCSTQLLPVKLPSGLFVFRINHTTDLARGTKCNELDSAVQNTLNDTELSEIEFYTHSH